MHEQKATKKLHMTESTKNNPTCFRDEAIQALMFSFRGSDEFTFSAVAEIWRLRTMPSRATSAGAMRVMSRPLKTMLPLVGSRNFVSRLKQVGLQFNI